LVAAPQKRRFVVLAKKKGLSERGACRLVRLCRTVARYQAGPKCHDNDQLVARLQEIAQKKRRRGYRLAHRQLRQEGWKVNHKRVHRLWKAAGLSIPARKTRKRLRRLVVTREVQARRPDGVWCLDFAQDRTIHGTKLRVLCVTDEFTRESLALEVERSFHSEQVCRVLEGLFVSRGIPAALRMDNGPEFIALALKGLCHRRGIYAAYIAPGRAPAVPEALAHTTSLWWCKTALRRVSFLVFGTSFWTARFCSRYWMPRPGWGCGVGTTTRSGCTRGSGI